MVRKFTLLFFLIIGFGMVSADNIGLSLYPNPAAQNVELTMTGLFQGTATIEVFSVIGTKLLEEEISITNETTKWQYNTAKLQEGIYLIRITQGNQTTVKRLRIQRG